MKTKVEITLINGSIHYTTVSSKEVDDFITLNQENPQVLEIRKV